MTAFIDALLERLLAASLQATLLALMVWLLCRLLPRLSPATQCWLWWLVALQVLLGLGADPVVLAWLPQETSVAPVLAGTAEPNLAASGTAEIALAVGKNTLLSWQSVAIALWMSGLVAMTALTLRDWRRSRALLANSVKCLDRSVVNTIEQAVRERGLRQVPELRMSGDIESPMVIGRRHPLLLLPARTRLRGEQLEMAVTHEMEHLHRRDLWWGLVPALARLCFFFHPIVHLAVREYGIAREAACDAAVVAGHRSRREYGELLLALGTAKSTSGLTAVSPTFRALSRRLTLLQKASFLPRAASMMVLLLAVAGVMPIRLVAAANPPEAPARETPAVSVSEVPARPVPIVDVGVPARDVRPSGMPTVERAAPHQARAVRVAAPASPAVASPSPGATSSRGTVAYRPDQDDYYPAASRSLGEQGRVEMRLCYDEQGRVLESTLATSSGFARLDEAAVRMGRRYRFIPAVVNGAPQPDCVVVRTRFPATYKAPGE